MYHIKGIFPGYTICTVRTGFRSHRAAREYMLKREGELRARFGMTLFVASGPGK